MLETTMNAVDLAKKLRAELTKLRAQRVKDLAAYDKDFQSWKKELLHWLHLNGNLRVEKITKGEVQRSYKNTFNTEAFFASGPKPPQEPSDERIRTIQAMLRHLGITGQKTVRVTSEDVERLFGTGE